MGIKEVEATLKEALKKPEDDDLREKYVNGIIEYLKTQKCTDKLITVVVKGIDIDRAANFYDYLQDASKEDFQSAWKQIQENKEIIFNKGNNGLKFVLGLLGLSFITHGNAEGIRGAIIFKLISMLTGDKKLISEETYTSTILDYFVDDVINCKNYPEWKTFKQSGTVLKKFAELLIQVTDGEQKEKYKSIRQWALNAMSFS